MARKRLPIARQLVPGDICDLTRLAMHNISSMIRITKKGRFARIGDSYLHGFVLDNTAIGFVVACDWSTALVITSKCVGWVSTGMNPEKPGQYARPWIDWNV